MSKEQPEALRLADEISSVLAPYCGAAAAELRNLHTENTALRVTEDNLRQELQECQDQRRAAFRRIEELDAMRAQIGQGEPVAWRWTNIKTERSGVYLEDPTIFGVRLDHPDYEWTPLYTHPAPQQKPLTDEQIDAVYREFMLYQDGLTPSGMKRVARAVERAHGIGEKK